MSASILLLDDDLALRALLVPLLRDRGFAVEEADRVEAAVTLLAQTEIAVAVVDTLLPDGSGHDVVAALRRCAPEMPIVLMSSSWRVPAEEDPCATGFGVARILRKPFSPGELLVHLNTLLGSAASVAAAQPRVEPLTERIDALRIDYRAGLSEELDQLARMAVQVRTDFAPGPTEPSTPAPNSQDAAPTALASAHAAPSSDSDPTPAPDTSASLPALRHRAHKLHGTAGMYGFVPIGIAAGFIASAADTLLAGDTAPAALWGEIDRALTTARTLLASDSTQRPHSIRETYRSQLPTLGASAGSAAEHTLRLARVLVVASDLDWLNHIRDLARDRLIEVRLAHSASHALLEAANCGVDAALIDAHLAPDSAAESAAPAALFELGHGRASTGERDSYGPAFRLARHLRALEGHSPLPIGLVSQTGHMPDRVAALHAGASLFLTRPLDGNAFADAVHTLVSEHHRAQPRILVVDRDGGFAHAMIPVLLAHRMEVEHLSDPGQVLDVLARFRPNLLLLDVHLSEVSEISGFEVCRLLRATSRWQDLPIVFVTVDTSAEVRMACFEAGGDDYLQAPVAARELVARIDARLERMRLLHERRDRDALTGLMLRRAFAQTLAARLSEAQRTHQPVSIALLDIDRFKQVNLDHGHLAGDRALITFGKLLASSFRANDLRGRWGGEEFIVAFYGEDAGSAAAILERTRRELADKTHEGDHGASFRLSFSAGVATYPRDGLALDQLLRVADRRLYRAKTCGGDRIEAGVRGN